MTPINWRASHCLEGRNGNRWMVKPTKDMALGFDTVKINTWKIKGVPTTYEVTYDRDYAIAYTKHHLSFLSQLPEDKRNEFIRDVVKQSATSDLLESNEPD